MIMHDVKESDWGGIGYIIQHSAMTEFFFFCMVCNKMQAKHVMSTHREHEKKELFCKLHNEYIQTDAC